MTPEQQALINKAQESLDAARVLAAKGFSDFAVSRAYYAMFYVAEAFLLGEGLSFSKHSAVIAAFGQRFTKTGVLPQDLHRHLIEGETSRNVGDYDTGSGLSPSDAEKQIERADAFLQIARERLGQ